MPNLCLRQAQAPFNSGLRFDARSPNALGIGAASFAERNGKWDSGTGIWDWGTVIFERGKMKRAKI